MIHKMFQILKLISFTVFFIAASCQPSVTPLSVDDPNEIVGVGTTTNNQNPDPVVDGEIPTILLPTGPNVTETVETDETSSTIGEDTTTLSEEEDVVNLKVQFNGHEGGDINKVDTSTGATIVSIIDNHDRIECSKTKLRCHTTYFAGTEVKIRAPQKVLIQKPGVFTWFSLIGWECNGSFLQLPAIEKSNSSFCA